MRGRILKRHAGDSMSLVWSACPVAYLFVSVEHLGGVEEWGVSLARSPKRVRYVLFMISSVPGCFVER